MLASIGALIAKTFASPAPDNLRPGGRFERAALLGAALVVGVWIFGFQMRRFLGLGTTSDLYVAVQLATSWLDGRFMQDNFFGHFLAIHVCFVAPLLAILAYPFGAPGLLLLLGLAAAFGVVALARILRLLGVPAMPALAYAVIATLMPLSVLVYQNDYRAFDIDSLEPVLALWLAYFLLRRKWAGSLVVALVLISVKEDASLLAIIVAVVVLSEDFIRSLGRDRRRRWNAPAAVVLLLGTVAAPSLLLFLKMQQSGAGSLNLAKLHPVGSGGITTNSGLFIYMAGHIGTWLRSTTVSGWLDLALAATFGLILLRPHLLIVGVGTTLIAWLVQDPLLWAPRFAPALAFFQLAGCLAFASFYGLVRDGWTHGWPSRLAAGALVLFGGCGLVRGIYQQWRTAPQTTELYVLSPALKISPADREKADRVFARYRRESRRDEPVMASQYLFRYAHDRNLFWPHSLVHKPRPVWILWDTKDEPLMALWVLLKTDAGIDLADYELLGREGRFLLFRSRTGPGPVRTLLPEMVSITGKADGAIRMQVQFPGGRAGYSEPLLSLGPKDAGEVFFVRYLSDRELVLGMESMGEKVLVSKPIGYEPGRPYELKLFSGSMLPPATAAADEPGQAMHMYYQNLVSISWEGKEELHAMALSHAIHPGEFFIGANLARSGSAKLAFTGRISAVQRGGYPPLPAGGLGDADYGAARMVVWLPAAAAGVPEPLLVVGVPGRATLGYVRVLPGGRAKFGAEFWGHAALESEEVAAPSDVATEITFRFPALYPPMGDPRWGGVSRAEQEARRSRLTITCNGKVVLDREVPATGAPSAPVVFAKNPVGGSWVNEKFSGGLLRCVRLPLTDP